MTEEIIDFALLIIWLLTLFCINIYIYEETRMTAAEQGKEMPSFFSDHWINLVWKFRKVSPKPFRLLLLNAALFFLPYFYF